MFAEELEKIKESEAEAERLLRKAKADAKQALADAKRQAEQIVADAREKADGLYDSLSQSGAQMAEEAYEKALALCKEECQVMQEKVKARQEEAVNMIIERIENRVNR